MVRRNQCGGAQRGNLIYDGRLYDSFERGNGASVDDAAERPNGIGPVYDVAAHLAILHDAAGDHDDVLGRVGQLLDDQIHHLPQASILVLEELRYAEEERGGFICREFLSRGEQVGNLGEQDAALPRGDWR